jgi:peptidoglycan/xylan/chitin deacetylase (PgdA/CDA1 family)
MYHSLDDSGSVISLSPTAFRRQMEHLSGQGWRVLALSTVVDLLRGGAPLPAKSVALTFDDGFESTYTVGLPILEAYGFSATVFLVTGYLGRLNEWPSQPSGLPRLRLLSWSQVEEMGRHGIQFGAHSVTHPLLPAIPPALAEREIGLSKAMIEDHLQRPVDLFAYPYGRHDGGIREIVSGLFRGACATLPRPVGLESDPWGLPRVDVYYLSADLVFRLLATPLLAPYLGLVRLARAVRRRLPGRASAGY